jgi:hypothetical protein
VSNNKALISFSKVKGDCWGPKRWIGTPKTDRGDNIKLNNIVNEHDNVVYQ